MNTMRVIRTLFLALVTSTVAIAQLPNVFEIEGGYVSGMEVAQLDDGTRVTAFQGIPYAAPPIGDLRFRPPTPNRGWPALYEAIVPAPACLQPDYPDGSFYQSPREEQSEDCLYLNVWTAATSPDAKLPVMVWIHGGALTRGSGSGEIYDGTNLARKGVVLVTLNYRLGPFGYLAHEALSAEDEHGSSGNYGVLDQVAALRWVRDNIGLFGGDPKRVTIFGESAGSWSVNALQATPLARGLFHRAIGQGGGLFGAMPQLTTDQPQLPSAHSIGKRFASKLGIEGEVTVEALRALPAHDILEASAAPGAFRTRPNVDGHVFEESIQQVFESGKQANVPVLLGSNENEATTLLGEAVLTDPERFVSRTRARFGDLAEAYLASYPAGTSEETRASFLRSMGDEWFTCKMRTWARLHETVDAKAYLYRFTRVPPHPEREKYGAYHAAEIAYVFNNLDAVDYDWETTDRELADAMSDIWVSFAGDGDPSTDRGSFPEYTTRTDTHLELGDRVAEKTGLSKTECDLLERFERNNDTSQSSSTGSNNP